MEASNQHKLEHGQRDDEVQGVSDEERTAELGDEEEVEGRAAKAAKDLGAPSAAEEAKHATLYLTGCTEAGTLIASEEEAGAASNYCVIGGERAANESPVVVIVDFETDMVFAHVCRKKGSDADVLETMMADIEVLGHRQIVFKSDQETSITALQRELAARRLEMRLENSPNYHSVANGRVENAVQRVIGFTRSLTDALEANIRQAIEPNMPVMTFMVNHAATIINRFSVDQDGRTPMEKARGTAANRDSGRIR